MGLILEFAGFYTYPWQNRLAEAQACIAYVGYRISSEIAIGDNDIAFEIELPPGIDELKARQKFLEVLNQSGFTLFLRTPVGGVILPPTPPIPPPKHFLSGMTNQDVINLFAKVFGNPLVNNQPAFIDALTRAQLIDIARNRLSNYSGPAVEDLPGLTTAEKDRILRILEI